MSDLISRKALLKALSECRSTKEFSHCAVQVLINSAPAIEQGEAVTKLWESLGRWSAYLTSNGEHAELSPPSWLIDAVKNATTPQQPQSVADALEEAAELCKIKSKQAYRHSEEAGMSFDDLEAEIRALIKRNAEGVE